MTVANYFCAGGQFIGNGLMSAVDGVLASIQSNSSASAGVNYFLKDNGGGVFVSTALPTGISFPTTVVTAAAQQMTSNQRYSVNATAACTLTLPATPAIGDTVQISGAGLGSTFNFEIQTNPTQTYSGSSGVKSAVNKSLTSTQAGSAITLYASSAGASANWVVTIDSGFFTET